jgi:hypothetical protein
MRKPYGEENSQRHRKLYKEECFWKTEFRLSRIGTEHHDTKGEGSGDRERPRGAEESSS